MDKSCKRLKEEINQIEDHLSKVGHQLKSAAETGVDTLEADLNKAKEKSEAKREQAADAVKRINQFIEETKNNAMTKFEDWKTDYQIEQIEKDADKKEQQAVDAVLVAAFACLEAEVAIMDALKTRKMAIEVAG